MFSFSGEKYLATWSHGAVQANFLSNLDEAYHALGDLLKKQDVVIEESAAEKVVFEASADEKDTALLCALSYLLVIYFDVGTLYTEVLRLRSRGFMLDRERERAVRALPAHTPPSPVLLPSQTLTHCRTCRESVSASGSRSRASRSYWWGHRLPLHAAHLRPSPHLAHLPRACLPRAPSVCVSSEPTRPPAGPWPCGRTACEGWSRAGCGCIGAQGATWRTCDDPGPRAHASRALRATLPPAAFAWPWRRSCQSRGPCPQEGARSRGSPLTGTRRPSQEGSPSRTSAPHG